MHKSSNDANSCIENWLVIIRALSRGAILLAIRSLSRGCRRNGATDLGSDDEDGFEDPLAEDDDEPTGSGDWMFSGDWMYCAVSHT